MDFKKLVEVYQELEETSSGNSMRWILSDFFKTVKDDEIGMIANLTLGQIASEYESVVLGMAEKSVLKAVMTASASEPSKIKKIMQEKGDVGLTAEEVLQNKPRTLIPLGKLTVKELFDKLHKISKITGKGSQDTKTSILASLLQKTSAKGAKYITRIALGTLRMGVGDMTVLDALAIAYTDDKKNKAKLEKAYNICPDLEVIAETLAKKGMEGIEKIDIYVSRPIKMMLAQRVKHLEEVSKKIPGELAIEAKYDGERMQAHKTKDGKITIFSRRLDNITSQFPDVVEYLGNISAREFVIEGEVLAIDKNGKPLHFQILMQRKRKTDIEEYVKKVPVQLKLFDLLYLNGKSYLHEPYFKRAQQLDKITKESGNLKLADKIITEDISKIDKFFRKMLDQKFEGVMIKGINSEYQAGTRGWSWIKWKKEYVSEMIDTFDLVIVGAFFGKGKRSGGYGALLCAVYNKKEDKFETVCRLGTGLTDETLAGLPGRLDKYKVRSRPVRLNINKEMEPDVWFEPKVVVEVLAAELTKSSTHTAGLALRFPRFIKFRDDKKAEQGTTVKEIRGIYG